MLHPLEVNVGEFTSTVRNGFKWSDLGPLEQIELCVCTLATSGLTEFKHRVSGVGEVVDLWFGRFQDIPARYIDNEHEISSRVYSGLLASMRRSYGDNFKETAPVTVVVYKRIQ
jgi:hypothetical protein